MAQIVTITNPLTGQPAQVDQLGHTAQQIDDAIARALPGGAIDLEKAPAGFGLGTTSQLITDWNDVNVGGWFWSDAGAANAPDPSLACFGTVYSEGNPVVFVQEVWGLANINKYYHWQRLVYPGSGTPWEWVNPPMILGVEYRTTERYLGKPVYTKAFDFGALPNNTYKDLLLTGLGIQDVIYLSGCVANNVLEPSALSGFIVSRYADDQRIHIVTNGDASAYSAVVVLKYTKTTD